MRTLYLLRHAKSSWHDENLRDFDRPLKKRGRDAAELVGRLIAAENLGDVLVVSSPAVRARETTEIMLRSSGVRAELRFDPQIYDADLESLLSVLRRIEDEKQTVILVGHNPGMEALLRFLTGETRAMPTAALAKISFDSSSWKSLNDGEGHLAWLVTPKDILSS
jgi:phosphohistidine phosphatase